MVLSEPYWRTRYGAADVLGRTLRIRREPFVVVGVLSATAGLRSLAPGATEGAAPDLWVPICAGSGTLDAGRFPYRALGRLRVGTSHAGDSPAGRLTRFPEARSLWGDRWT